MIVHRPSNFRMFIDGEPGPVVTHLELPSMGGEQEWTPHVGPLAFDLSATFTIWWADYTLYGYRPKGLGRLRRWARRRALLRAQRIGRR